MSFPTPTTTIAELDGWWIELRCSCRVVFQPCKLLARDGFGRHQAGGVARRFRCERCGQRAERPSLTNDPQALYGGAAGAPGVRIPLA